MQAAKAKAAVEALASSAEWHERRAMNLALVLEHLIQAAGDRKAQGAMRRRIEKLESAYRKVAADADLGAVMRIDLSAGLAERYGVSE